MLAPSGMALGMDQGRLFDEALSEMEIHLGSGDTLVFYTDGVTEAMNDQGEEYQMERFVDTLQKSRSESSNRILDAIHESLSNFTGDLPQHDDLTLVLVKVQSAGQDGNILFDKSRLPS
jgi:sigma-B regulation protein RsbU (phosphoserine phosphatase)